MEQLSGPTDEQGLLDLTVQGESQDQLSQIRYQGDTYEVPARLAAIWRKREEDFNRRLSAQGQELGQLRQQTRATPPTPTLPASATTPQDADLQFFTAPTQTLDMRLTQFREQLRAEQEQQRRLEAQQQRYWNTFYRENPHLVGRERLVNAVVMQEFDRLKDLSPEEGQQVLVEVIEEMLGGTSAERRVLSNRQVTSERASPTRPPPARRVEPEDEPVVRGGVSAAIKARAERRRRAQFNIAKEEK